MLRIRRSIAVAAAMLATALCAAESAQAGSVIYSTSGAFYTSTNVLIGSSVLVGDLSSGSTLSFTGLSSTVFTGTPGETNYQQLTAGLGSFDLVSNGTGDGFDGLKFVLTITQTFPTSDAGSSTASIEGTVSAASPASNAYIFAFTPSTINFSTPAGTLKYRPDAGTEVVVNSGPTLLEGSVSMPAGTPAVPLPPAVAGGLALMGITALRRGMRTKAPTVA